MWVPPLCQRVRMWLRKKALPSNCFQLRMQADPVVLSPSLMNWQKSVPPEQPTENMMKWMRHYALPCPLLCCRSPDCATIKCSFCSKSLTSAIGSFPIERYECAECDPVECDSFTTRSTVLVSATTMCADCFGSAAALHRHSALFLRIDSAGCHTVASRPVPAAPVRELQPDDFTPLPHIQGQCQCCEDHFSVVVPAVSVAFCSKGHGICSTRDSSGKICQAYDTRTFYCCGCALQWERGRGRQHYDFPDAYCEVCVSQREADKWKEEFEIERQDAEVQGDCEVRARRLRELHTQPWIRALVDHVFAA
jgi:hypothetical protein